MSGHPTGIVRMRYIAAYDSKLGWLWRLGSAPTLGSTDLSRTAMKRCIRCDGELEQGFMVDKGDDNASHQAQWASGQPHKSFWRISAVRSDSKMLLVVTYRCKNCGRLESFAQTTD